VDYGRNDRERNQDSVFSKKLKAGKRRTYFFDVRMTKGEDYYITLTESTRKFNGNGYERHKIFLYKEDFNRFQEFLEETIDHVKTELMPDYDYNEYKKKNEEWEKRRAEEGYYDGTSDDQDESGADEANQAMESDEDISW
jgi:hypothetical protein